MFAGIGFPHAENMSSRTTWHVTHHDQASLKAAVTDDASFTIVSAGVLKFYGYARKDDRGVCEIETSIRQSPRALGWIEADVHRLL